MHRRILAGDRLIAAFLIGCVLFNYPVLSLFDRPTRGLRHSAWSMPTFFAWALVIALMAWAVERRFK
jgi:hypothetical protein